MLLSIEDLAKSNSPITYISIVLFVGFLFAMYNYWKDLNEKRFND